MLCSFALFVSSSGFIGPEKPHWGSGQLGYIYIFFLTLLSVDRSLKEGSEWLRANELENLL